LCPAKGKKYEISIAIDKLSKKYEISIAIDKLSKKS
jgi:hypothetical protein